MSMTFGALFSYIVFQLLLPAIFALSFVTFVWGGFLYLIAGTRDEELQEKGKGLMVYGFLALAVMALIAWLLDVLGIAVGGA